MKTATEIRQAIKSMPAGKPFLVSCFLALGNRSSIDQAISRLAREGVIMRVSRGVYVRPKSSRLFGQAMPPTEAIIKAVTEAHGETVEIHGAEAERRFGLSTQTMMKPVYLTSGPSRKVRIGKLEVELRHASARKLTLAGTKAGQAMLALLNRGKAGVGEREIDLIRKQLRPEEFKILTSAHGLIPGWLSAALSRSQLPQHV